MKNVTLQKPLGVVLIAYIFILVPIINLLLSFSNSGLPDWYEPFTLIALFRDVPILDLIWIALLFIAGVLLLKPGKVTWFSAVGALLIVILINSFRIATKDPLLETAYVRWEMMFSSVLSVAIFVLSYYFRYPYIDLRRNWLYPSAERYDFATGVQVVAQDIFEGVTESVSLSGVRVRLQKEMDAGSKDLHFVDVIFPDLRGLKIKARVIEIKDNILRLQFKEVKKVEKQVLSSWFKSQSETNISKPG